MSRQDTNFSAQWPQRQSQHCLINRLLPCEYFLSVFTVRSGKSATGWPFLYCDDKGHLTSSEAMLHLLSRLRDFHLKLISDQVLCAILLNYILSKTQS